MPTFVYGDELDFYPIEVIESNYELGKTYIVEGKLNETEYSNLIECLTKSASVKKKFQKVLLS